MNKIINKTYIIFSLSFILFGAVIALLTSFINYKLQYTNIDKDIIARFELEKSIKVEALDKELESLNILTHTLATNKITQDLIDQTTPERLANAQNLFMASAKANTLIMQIRFLDKNGKEKVRVDRSKNGKEVYLITDEELQDKGSRYYFVESSKLRPMQFWHSNLDLNLEGGEFEQPLRPTFRVATPVYNKNKFSGVVIVNIEAKYLIDSLIRSSDFDEMIIDADGEFISHSNKEYVWSRYLKDTPNFLTLFPEIGRKVLLEGEIDGEKFYRFRIAREFKNGEKLQVILFPKTTMLSELSKNNLITALILAVTVIIVSFPLSWIAAMIPARLQSELQKTLTDLKHTNDIIDQNVMSNTLDSDGRIIRASHAFCLGTGYNLGELLDQKYSILTHPDSPEQVYKEISKTLKNAQIWRGELHNIKKSGEGYWIDMVITPQLDLDGNVIGCEQISQDITAKKEVELLSITDPLTQLYNRRKIDLILGREMSRFNRFQQVFSVILLDLDHFKRVNDTFGHQVGDDVLVETALTLKENCREIDAVGRWGGEEFLIVLKGTDITGAKEMAEKLRKAVYARDFQPVEQVSASFGVAQSQRSESLSKLISRVDTALYQAKSDGRNRVSLSHIDTDISEEV